MVISGTAMRHQRLQCLAMRRKLWQETFIAGVEAFFGGVDDATMEILGIAEGHRWIREVQFAENFAALATRLQGNPARRRPA